MGSIISRIYDDYHTYVDFCKLVNENPIDIHDDFYNHEKELMKKYQYVKKGCWYEKININTENPYDLNKFGGLIKNKEE